MRPGWLADEWQVCWERAARRRQIPRKGPHSLLLPLYFPAAYTVN
ncbi:hypothetical protein HMPREF0262_01369 [Clostridium sp. ATCC 29733]|nr:hypothetical protein HMPREF0262_01369 [Clostridium sp. ATCC 29733]